MNDLNYRDDMDINKLRELRNKLSDMSYKVQRRIDEIILEKNDFSKYNKNFICAKNQDNNTYMYVTKIRRLNTGCRLHGIAYRNEGDYLMLATDLTIDCQIGSCTKIEIITENEFYSNLSDFYQDMKCKFQNIIQDD